MLCKVCYTAFTHSVLCNHLLPFYNLLSAKSAKAIHRITHKANYISGQDLKHPLSDIEDQQKNIVFRIYCDEDILLMVIQPNYHLAD